MTEIISSCLALLLIVVKYLISGELDRKAADAALAQIQSKATAFFDAAETAMREKARQNQKPASDLQDQLEQERKRAQEGQP